MHAQRLSYAGEWRMTELDLKNSYIFQVQLQEYCNSRVQPVFRKCVQLVSFSHFSWRHNIDALQSLTLMLEVLKKNKKRLMALNWFIHLNFKTYCSGSPNNSRLCRQILIAVFKLNYLQKESPSEPMTFILWWCAGLAIESAATKPTSLCSEEIS